MTELLAPFDERRRTGPLEPFEKRALIGFAIAALIQAIAGTYRANLLSALPAVVGIVICGALWLLRSRHGPGHALAMPAGLLIATAGLYSAYTAMNAPFVGFLSRFSLPLLLILVGALLLFAEQEWSFQVGLFALAAIVFVVVQVVLTTEARTGGQPIPSRSGVSSGRSGIISEMEMVQVGRSFVDAINAHDPSAIVALTTPDHRFIDSLGNTIAAAKLSEAWTGYFRMVPDYRITVTRWMSDGTTVVALGTAAGTTADATWTTPAAWRATIRDGKVAEWQVYADNEPIREIMRRGGPQ